MNIIDLQDNLKNLPENALMKEMQQPTGSAPPFLILGELKRRKQMRDDYNRQQNSDMKTVAEETVTAAGMPQDGIMQASRSLTPKTNMAQNTGIASATPVQPTQASQPQAPQMMSGGGIMRLAPGGKTPSSKPIAFVGGLPFYVSGDGKSIVDGEGRTVTESSILNSIAQSMISQSEARGSESPTGGFDSPQGIASVSADASDFVPGGVFDATQSYSSAPQMNVREPLVSEIGSQNNRFTTNLQGVFQPRFLDDTPQQQAMVAANQGDDSGIVLESGYIPTNIGPTELNTPAMRNALPTDSGAGLATGLRYAAGPRQGTDGTSEAERAMTGDFLFSDKTGVSRDGRTNEEILAQAKAAMAMFGQEGRDEAGNLLPVAGESAASFAAAAALQATPSGSDGSINFSDLERANLALEASEDGRIQELLSPEVVPSPKISDVIKPGFLSNTGVPRTQQPRINTLDGPQSEDDTNNVMDVVKNLYSGFTDTAQDYFDARRDGTLPGSFNGSDTALTRGFIEADFSNLTDGDPINSNVAGGNLITQDGFSFGKDVPSLNPRATTDDLGFSTGQEDAGGAGTTTSTGDVGTKTSTVGTGGGLSGSIAQMLQDRQKSAESDKWMALAQTGLALMASDQPTIGGAIGEAGLAGIGALQQSRKGLQDFEIDMFKLQAQTDAANQKSGSKGGLTGGNVVSLMDDLRDYKSGLIEKIGAINADPMITDEAVKNKMIEDLQIQINQTDISLARARGKIGFGPNTETGSSFDVRGGNQSTGNQAQGGLPYSVGLIPNQ